jgi:hypothetical protein
MERVVAECDTVLESLRVGPAFRCGDIRSEQRIAVMVMGMSPKVGAAVGL